MERMDLNTYLAVLKNRVQERHEASFAKDMAAYQADLDQQEKQRQEAQAVLQKVADKMLQTEDEKRAGIDKGFRDLAAQLR